MSDAILNLTEASLQDLRAYRQRLREEEDKVSYLRRLLHARVDMLDAYLHTEGGLGLQDLVRILGDACAGHTRNALARVRSDDPLPLPGLAGLPAIWVTEIDPDDRETVTEAMSTLRAAEQQLTAHRNALHQRIDKISEELIARYRTNPMAALQALPR